VVSYVQRVDEPWIDALPAWLRAAIDDLAKRQHLSRRRAVLKIRHRYQRDPAVEKLLSDQRLGIDRDDPDALLRWTGYQARPNAGGSPPPPRWERWMRARRSIILSRLRLADREGGQDLPGGQPLPSIPRLGQCSLYRAWRASRSQTRALGTRQLLSRGCPCRTT